MGGIHYSLLAIENIVFIIKICFHMKGILTHAKRSHYTVNALAWHACHVRLIMSIIDLGSIYIHYDIYVYIVYIQLSIHC